MLEVPKDGRRQYPRLVVTSANASLGRAPFDGVERVGEDRYVLTPPSLPTLQESPAVAASKPMK
jgi:hypothetical protein